MKLMTPAISIYAQSVKRNYDNSRDFYYKDSIYLTLVRNEEIKKQFEKFSSVWKLETMFVSNTSDLINNAAHKKIINLGSNVLPFIIQDLKDNNSLWFFALHSITGLNPIKKEHKGVFKLMKQDWLDWAENNL